jgi:hypothetical protein
MLESKVKDGTITQAQADTALENMQTRLTERVNSTTPGGGGKGQGRGARDGSGAAGKGGKGGGNGTPKRDGSGGGRGMGGGDGSGTCQTPAAQ